MATARSVAAATGTSSAATRLPSGRPWLAAVARVGMVLAWLLVVSVARAAEVPIALATAEGALAGTLLMPEGARKVPVVLLIAGSGPTDRNGNGPTAATRNDSLERLAQALAAAGVASVRYDKRGVAASAAAARSEADLRFDDYVRDAAAWVAMLAKDERFFGVTIIGHSEGSLIGMIAARESPAKAFVSLAGVVEPAGVVLRRQLAGRLPPDLVPVHEALLQSLEAGRTVADVPPQLAALYRPSVQPYLVSWLRRDPAQEIASLTVPCLVVQGDTDLQVRVDDARALGAAQPHCKVVIVPGMNHVLKLVPADRARQVASYGDPSLPVAPALVEAIATFVLAVPAASR